MDPKLRNLLKQGERAARLGKTQAAEDVYRQAVVQFPNSAEAWLGLGEVASSEEEKLACRRRAAELDPTVGSGDVGSTQDSVNLAPEHTLGPETPSGQLDAVLLESRRRLREATGDSLGAAEKRMSQVRLEEEVPGPGPEPADEMTKCYYHPAVETNLRCNRCSKPICTRCAVSTPVGYRCKDCVREQQGIFYSALWYDYVLAAVVTVPLTAIACVITSGLGWLTIFVAPFVGGVIAEAARLATRKRRGRWLPLAVTAAMVAGALPVIANGVLGFLFGPSMAGNIVWQVVFLILAISSAYYRIR